MKFHDTLEVYVEVCSQESEPQTLRAGTLGASFLGGRVLAGTWFEYSPSYLNSHSAYSLDPALPLTKGRIYSGADSHMFGTFQDLAPDEWGKRIIEANLAESRGHGPGTTTSIGAFDYLALSSDEARPGSLRIRASEDDRWLGTDSVPEIRVTDLDTYASAAARFEAHEATSEDLELLRTPGTSAGGARPKVTVRVNGELRLIKLPSERDRGRDGEAWEFLAIDIARRAGIDVQTGELLRTTDGMSSLSLKRFDRTRAGDRIGFMSARTALEISDQGHPQHLTYEDLADTVDSLSGGDRQQLKDLFKRVALTVLINNVDDHWKNHGFLRLGERWALSPAYDINPSISRGVVTSRQISSADDPRNRDIRNLTRTASSYALTRDDAASALSEVLNAVRLWPKIARELKISGGEITSMSPAFSLEQQGYAESEIERLGVGPRTIDLQANSKIQSVPTKPQKSEHGEDLVWVKPHLRNGVPVAGFWRRTPDR